MERVRRLSVGSCGKPILTESAASSAGLGVPYASLCFPTARRPGGPASLSSSRRSIPGLERLLWT
eukprot:scaffold766_cov343-Pavlova_lutheri.AAC.2